MDTLIGKLSEILKRQFPGAETDLETAAPATKVGGFIIWEGFTGLDPAERQERIWKTLREELSVEEQLGITAILTVTPDELAVMREG